MAIVSHPSFPQNRHEVADGEVESWKNQGWVVESDPTPEELAAAQRTDLGFTTTDNGAIVAPARPDDLAPAVEVVDGGAPVDQPVGEITQTPAQPKQDAPVDDTKPKDSKTS